MLEQLSIIGNIQYSFKKVYHIRILLIFLQKQSKKYNLVEFITSISPQICTMGLADWMLSLRCFACVKPYKTVIVEHDVSVDLSYLIYQIAIHGFIQTRWRYSVFLWVKFYSQILHTAPTHFKSLSASADSLKSRSGWASISICWSYSITYSLHWYWCSSQLFNIKMKVLLRDFRDGDWAPVNNHCYWLQL